MRYKLILLGVSMTSSQAKDFFEFSNKKTDSKVRFGPLVGWISPWIDWPYAINCFAWMQWLSFLFLGSRNIASQWCLFPHFLSLKQLSWRGIGFDPSIKIEPIKAGTIHFFLPTLFYFSSQLVEERPLFWNQFLLFHMGVQLLSIKSFYTCPLESTQVIF